VDELDVWKRSMRDYNIYRVQTILGLCQAGIVIFGSLFVGVMLKAQGYPGLVHEIPMKLAFIRNWGFLLILIPLGWTLITIWLERSLDWHSRRWTIASGLFLTGWLFLYLLKMFVRAGHI
jgi:hypothetical protein